MCCSVVRSRKAQHGASSVFHLLTSAASSVNGTRHAAESRNTAPETPRTHYETAKGFDPEAHNRQQTRKCSSRFDSAEAVSTAATAAPIPSASVVAKANALSTSARNTPGTASADPRLVAGVEIRCDSFGCRYTAAAMSFYSCPYVAAPDAVRTRIPK